MNNVQKRMLALGRLPAGVMNKTEAEFARELEMQLKAGLISDWKFEVETFKLGKDCRYTPDFRVFETDRTITFYEVKGFWTDDARVKIKVAAQQNPMYRFIAVKKRPKKDGGGWIREEF